ncbi:putative flavin-binding monooxygenase [Xylona heveae TC161]|uniref:Putative flavin-binding monooxygenase n=1 Tax=Xylona heveae (strain CBS 132557 / TC161) TaxID=1328760 RepID=A0A164ZC95_XYLHT|nr:putative flavin-binding monooxygenase [Xylona heveae TC161]KZF18925.1 putative flavin-binding monooxygenase [Xylona heveae TC161]
MTELGQRRADVPPHLLHEKLPTAATKTEAIVVEKEINAHETGGANASSTSFELEDHPIDQPRDLKVAVIGAGLSGVLAGSLIPAKVPGLNLTIFEKNADVGGTWYENVYPGVKCDIPANVYQSTFSPKTNWSEEFAPGGEIRDYWQSVAKKHNVYKHLKLKHKVQKAEWLPDSSKWKVTVENLAQPGEIHENEFDILVTAIGRFNAWKLPEYDGIQDFKGELFHSSHWDKNFSAANKRVALIGNGASGLQLLPELQRVADHVDHYARNTTWIVDAFASAAVRTIEPKPFSAEQLKEFADPEKYLEYRRKEEGRYYRRFAAIFKDTPENKQLRETWTALMLKRVGDKPELADKIIPNFPPNCRRPTPGPGYLEALAKENVDYIQTPIQRFTESGIVTKDGFERKVDAVICATGANIDLAPPFPVIANGIDLSQAWKPGGHFGFPYTYLGVATPQIPNAFWIGGPMSTGQSGTVPNNVENQITYIAKVIRKVRSQGIKTIVPSKAAADDFISYSDAFFERTVWTANDDSSEYNKNCRSWYNGGVPGGRPHGIFPGSASHANFVRREPRWEDFEYTHVNPSGNRFAYFGNGWTSKELQEDADLTPYLRLPSEIDLRSYHEGWWDL